MIELVMVGGGKMGEALLGGLLEAGWAPPERLAVVEKLPARADELRRLFPGVAVSETVVPAAAALLAVKPNDVPAACRALAELGAGAPTRVLSIAAGVTIAALEACFDASVAVVRAMPNTPALVGKGAAAIAAGHAAGPDDLAWAESILRAVGSVAVVGEYQLDAVTGLSGSGPAYVFLVAEALIEAGVLNGLARPVAQDLAIQTLLGAATLLAAGERSAADLRADVTSPGGTTAAGLQVLEQRAVRAAFLDAVTAATARSAELGRG
ncbi:MAG: pyrroline-5-carboxylate reductase [Acidimicrobiales bacterium]|nr:pyrroline-5-carboxylate reductase [Acidimicrobiales bacterium]